jgi:RNA recognition motif-containing protein
LADAVAGISLDSAAVPKTKKPRAPKREYTGELSPTTIFVSNLPYAVKGIALVVFNVSDNDLMDIFKDFTVVTAHVVTLRNGQSKGFGFVEVSSHEEQLRVLRDFEEIVVDERTLVVKAANAHQPKEEATTAE